jgi:hypothetical protein
MAKTTHLLNYLLILTFCLFYIGRQRHTSEFDATLYILQRSRWRNRWMPCIEWIVDKMVSMYITAIFVKNTFRCWRWMIIHYISTIKCKNNCLFHDSGSVFLVFLPCRSHGKLYLMTSYVSGVPWNYGAPHRGKNVDVTESWS